MTLPPVDSASKEYDIAMKHDQGKPMLSLLDYTWLLGVAKVLTFGAKKYSPHNWRKGFTYCRLMDAMQRHLLAFNDGEDNDPETGLSHLYHASCCIMFLANMKETRPDLDDRHRKEENCISTSGNAYKAKEANIKCGESGTGCAYPNCNCVEGLEPKCKAESRLGAITPIKSILYHSTYKYEEGGYETCYMAIPVDGRPVEVDEELHAFLRSKLALSNPVAANVYCNDSVYHLAPWST